MAAVLVLFTERCLSKDLADVPAEAQKGLLKDANDWARAGCPPFGEEHRYRSVPVPKMRTFHHSDYRAVAWHEQARGAVWICLAGYHKHRDESGPDVYDRGPDLLAAGVLLPLKGDFVAFETARLRSERDESLQRAFAMLGEALSHGFSTRSVFGYEITLVSEGDGVFELQFPMNTDPAYFDIIRDAVFGGRPVEQDDHPSVQVYGARKVWSWILMVDDDGSEGEPYAPQRR